MKTDTDAVLTLERAEILDEDSACAKTSFPKLNTDIIIGVLEGFEESGIPLVNFLENTLGQPVPARTTVPLTTSQIGCEVVLAFERGNLASPIVLGSLLSSFLSRSEERNEKDLDTENLTFSAEREIVFRCGKASITITRAGKVLICGAYLLSRSSGVNRIKGGSVQIN